MNAAGAKAAAGCGLFQRTPRRYRPQSGGIKFGAAAGAGGGGRYSGYSTSVQQKYQSYLIAERAILINGKFAAGRVRRGLRQGQVWRDGYRWPRHILGGCVPGCRVEAAESAAIYSGWPGGEFRLYQGRDYVVITAADL